VSEKDVKDASAGVLKDLKRFQKQKEEDLRRYMVSSVACRGSVPAFVIIIPRLNHLVVHVPLLFSIS